MHDTTNPQVPGQLGVDIEFLQTLPKGGHGKEWPGPWRIACEVMFVNGFTPAEIARQLDGPDRRTIYEWAEAGAWLAKRDEHTREIAGKALAQSSETQLEMTRRHLLTLQTAQKAALKAMVQQGVEAKSLEGVIAALVAAVREEARVYGVQPAADVVIEDNRTQVMFAQLDANPQQRARLFELFRQRFDLEGEIQELTGGITPLPLSFTEMDSDRSSTISRSVVADKNPESSG